MKIWRGQPDDWKPTNKDKGRFWLGLSLVSFLLAASSFSNATQPPFTGRWGWLHQMFFDAFGSHGDLAMYCLFAGIALVTGFSYLFRKE